MSDRYNVRWDITICIGNVYDEIENRGSISLDVVHSGIYDKSKTINTFVLAFDSQLAPPQSPSPLLTCPEPSSRLLCVGRDPHFRDVWARW